MLNPETGEFVEDLNQDQEDKISDEELDKELAKLDDEDDDVLSYIQKETNKVFKTKEDLVKTLKQMDVDFAQGKVTPKKEEPKTEVKPSQTTDVSLSERLMLIEKPESKTVIEDIKRDHPGQDPYVVYNNSQFYQSEANVRFAKEEASKRMQTPGNQTDGSGEKTQEQLIEEKWLKKPAKGFNN